MKKVLFLMAVAGMFSFVACNNNKTVDEPAALETEAVEAIAEETTETVENAVSEVVENAESTAEATTETVAQ